MGIYLRRLGLFCEKNNITPKGLQADTSAELDCLFPSILSRAFNLEL
jgi:hypothetical protein